MSADDRERWDARYREGAPTEPSLLVTELDHELPRRGRALDLAGGAGRHAVWLAGRGLEVTLADVSPVGLERAAEAARAAGVALTRIAIDLEAAPLPAGPWQLILSFHYLQRALFPAFAAALAPGGLLLGVQPTRRNLERHAKPGAAFLLEEGELRELCGPLEIVRYDEGWLSDQGVYDPSSGEAERASLRHEARVLARRPARW